MGGRGSGRQSDFSLLVSKTSDYHSIDLAWLHRQGAIDPGYSGTLRWSRGGNETGSIGYRIEQKGLRLIYRSRSAGGEWQDVMEVIPFATTSAQFGGRRSWFECPSCRRRCRIIYGGTQFRCRQCHRLKYESQYEPPHYRAASRAHNIRARLGQRGSLGDPFPPKPKGMHWKRYLRLESEDERLQRQWMMGMARWLDALKKGS